MTKPRLFVYSTNRDITTNVVLKFAQGASIDKTWEVRFQKVDKFVRSGLDKSLRPGIDAVASLGVLRGTGEMFKSAAKENIDYYYIDHAYFNPGYGNDGWMRIVKNNHSMNYIGNSTGKRYLKFFKDQNSIMPWKTSDHRGDKIVVCPPTNAVSWYAGLTQDWTESVVGQLKNILPENQHHRIVVRLKPNEPLVDDVGNLIGFKQNISNGSLNDDLESAQCVIVYNSMVALTATLKGIPVIVSDYSCCKPIGFAINDILNPSNFDNEPADREKLAYWLADNQWNISEIKNGTAWRHLQEIGNGI